LQKAGRAQAAKEFVDLLFPPKEKVILVRLERTKTGERVEEGHGQN
jgi:hypothetical protein